MIFPPFVKREIVLCAAAILSVCQVLLLLCCWKLLVVGGWQADWQQMLQAQANVASFGCSYCDAGGRAEGARVNMRLFQGPHGHRAERLGRSSAHVIRAAVVSFTFVHCCCCFSFVVRFMTLMRMTMISSSNTMVTVNNCLIYAKNS